VPIHPGFAIYIKIERERGRKKGNHLKNRIDDGGGDDGGKYLFTQLTEKEERKFLPVVGRTKSSSRGGGGGTGLGRLAHAFVEYKKKTSSRIFTQHA
jgi:hypothetical protein